MKLKTQFISLGMFLLLLINFSVHSQNIQDLIPENTATHTAVNSGSWFDVSTWNTGTVPTDAAIVVIPAGITVNYEGQSPVHIFAIRVDGTFICTQTNAAHTTTLTFDTFVGTHMSFVKFLATNPTDGEIDVSIAPFDIEAHKSGTSGYSQVWNSNAVAHFSDGATTYEVSRTVNAASRYRTYEDAVADNVTVTENSRTAVDDGPGVLGRHDWDPGQISLGLMVMGQIEIIGQEKLNMSRLASDAARNQKTVVLETIPTGWEVGDKIVITSGGRKENRWANGIDEAEIHSISGTTLTTVDNLGKEHIGRAIDDLHCYVGNLTRNITFSSPTTNDIHHRGHFMAMHNDENVQIRNAAFVEMGRTDKSKLLDDFIWNNWLEPKTVHSFISALGQECSESVKNPKDEITNPRGRYSIHLHRTGAQHDAKMTYVTGNVVWGNPGWAITHHDSHATIAENVVYDVVGSGIVSESGSETGFWDDNLVVKVEKRDRTLDIYTASTLYDDYLFGGEGLGMKGRGVICRGNVITDAVIGVKIENLNPNVTNQVRMDATALANRPGYEVDNFPLSVNGYSIEGDGVMPQEVALIMENTTVINCFYGLNSIERDMGLNHESRSIFDGFFAWGISIGLEITYQADYSFKDVFISGIQTNESFGIDLFKHSHNQSFENIKLVDLAYGVNVTKVSGSEHPYRSRNNGFTPWIFVDLETENITKSFYRRIMEEKNVTPIYTEEHDDNTIHLSSSDISTRPTTFTILDSSTLVVDYATNDFRFDVDGIVTDDFGSYDMGVRQSWAQGNLRYGYPERIYRFASQAKFEEYLTNNGVYKHPDTDELYFILNESLPNRRTFEFTAFPVRVKINNAPTTGVFANPQIEPSTNFEPQSQIISRFATVSQSSTDVSLTYNGESIDASAEKAIDGNTNGRINVQFLQQGLQPIGSISATTIENEPWYDLDLGEIKEIDFIDIWNRVILNGLEIETYSTYFKNFYVLISDTPFGSMDLATARNSANHEYFKDGSSVSRKFSLNNLNASGRYVRIQAVGNTKLELAEVEIIGKTPSTTLGINKETALEKAVYPNPTDGKLTIDLRKQYKNVSLKIMNILGQVIFLESYKDIKETELEFNGSPGLYFLELNTGNKHSEVYKILKK